MTSDLVTIHFPGSTTASERMLELRSLSSCFSYRDFDWSLHSKDGIFIFQLSIHFEQEGLGIFEAKAQLKLPGECFLPVCQGPGSTGLSYRHGRTAVLLESLCQSNSKDRSRSLEQR